MPSLRSWAAEILERSGIRADVSAYVSGVLSERDLAELVCAGSVVLAASEAVTFEHHRRLADGVLAAEVAFPGWLSEPELCVTLARRSYEACWRILRGRWELYGELAERLPSVISVAERAFVASCVATRP